MGNKNDIGLLNKGVEAWNRWREAHPGMDMNLKGVNLKGRDLTGGDFADTDFSRADLQAADLRNTFLEGAIFREANLDDTKFAESPMDRTSFRHAYMRRTLLYALDLSTATGLELVNHGGPSSISTDTLRMSKGQVPQPFLRGCGLSDWEIELARLYVPDLSEGEINDVLYEVSRLRGSQPIVISSLFVSYSHLDSEFVEALEPLLDGRGIRYWRDIHDLRAGRIERQVDLAIRENPTVLVVLSRHSVLSDWVEWEVERARELERKLGRDVLCPVALDAAWKTCRWPGRLRQQIQKYYILDFSLWKTNGFLGHQFQRLLEGLALFYNPQEQTIVPGSTLS